MNELQLPTPPHLTMSLSSQNLQESERQSVDSGCGRVYEAVASAPSIANISALNHYTHLLNTLTPSPIDMSALPLTTRPQPPPAAASRGHQLHGRLGDGTLHRNGARQAVEALDSTVAKQQALSQYVGSSVKQGGWAAEFTSSAELRAAVTSNTDHSTSFEEQLLEEINRVRRDPKGYAAVFEREVTVGYPFVLGDDEYFASDAAALTVTEYPSLKNLLYRQPSGPTVAASSGRRLTDQESCRGSSLGIESRPTSATPHIVPLGVLASLDETPPAESTYFRTTLKEQGMTELTLDQLRIHFRRHQARRGALEKTIKDLMASWQTAQQSQRDAWAMEDERMIKKNRRNASRKKSALPNADELVRERQRAMEKMSRVFAEQLRNVDEELQHERKACRRAMDGANLILESIRSLRDADPVPPLRCCRGLVLSARDSDTSFHSSQERLDLLLHMSRMFSSTSAESCHTGIVPLEMPDDSCEDAMASLMQQLEQREGFGEGHGVVSTDVDVISRIPASPAQLRDELLELGNTAHRACLTYGYVSGEVRGIIAYDQGTPRELVMRMLLGVIIPRYAFTDNASLGPMHSMPCGGKPSLLDTRRSPGASAFEGTIFSGIANSSDAPSALGTPTVGMTICGVFHPTSVATADSIVIEEEAQTTSAGKRAAAAAHRLGPLLWRHAHLFGCSWQRGAAHRPIPSYDEDKRDVTWQAALQCTTDTLISTSIIVASGYEELDLIHQRDNFALGQVRRMVFEQRGMDTTVPGDHLLSEPLVMGMKSDLPAVVDLHSALHVELIHPTSHPLLLSRSQAVLVLALRAAADRVQLQVCLGDIGDTVPTLPHVDPSRVHLQRSLADRHTVLVFVDVPACFEGSNAQLLHLFERDVTLGAASGYSHIGFVRLLFQEAIPLRSNSITARGPAVRTVASLRMGPSPPPPVLPAPHDELLFDTDLTTGRFTTETAGGLRMPVGRGWPTVTSAFHERSGSLLSPMTASVQAGGEGVRIAVYYPSDVPYLKTHIETVSSLLIELSEADALDEADDAGTASVTSAGEQQSHTVSLVGAAQTAEERPMSARRKKKRTPSSAGASTGSIVESAYRAAELRLQLLPESLLRADHTPQELAEKPLFSLRCIVDDMERRIEEVENCLAAAVRVLSNETDFNTSAGTGCDPNSSIGKQQKKGRERSRARQDEDAFELQVGRTRKQLDALENLLCIAKHHVTRRERNQRIRATRIVQLEEELNALQSRISLPGPLSVKLWLVDASSMLSATTCVDPAPHLDDSIPISGSELRDENTNIVTLQPQTFGQGTLYEVTCTVPDSYRGRAVLLVDGVEAVSWVVTAVA